MRVVISCCPVRWLLLRRCVHWAAIRITRTGTVLGLRLIRILKRMVRVWLFMRCRLIACRRRFVASRWWRIWSLRGRLLFNRRRRRRHRWDNGFDRLLRFEHRRRFRRSSRCCRRAVLRHHRWCAQEYGCRYKCSCKRQFIQNQYDQPPSVPCQIQVRASLHTLPVQPISLRVHL